jgi:hypothetical protein
MKKFRAWFKYAPKIWIFLAIGWLAVLLAISPLITLDQSGALLICCVVIGEIFIKNGHQAFLDAMGPGITTKFTYFESKSPHSDDKCIKIVASQTKSEGVYVNSNDWSLYNIANKKEFWGKGEQREWLYSQTFNRVESTIRNVLVANMVIGTVLWAFG